MRLNDAGGLVLAEWCALPDRFSVVELDACVVVPNHVHGIVMVGAGQPQGLPLRGALIPMADAPMTGIPGNRATTVGDVVGAFKSLTTVHYVRGVKEFDWPPFSGRLWQRNYYEHIIRDDQSLNRIRCYILDNSLCRDMSGISPTAAIDSLCPRNDGFC